MYSYFVRVDQRQEQLATNAGKKPVQERQIIVNKATRSYCNFC